MIGSPNAAVSRVKERITKLGYVRREGGDEDSKAVNMYLVFYVQIAIFKGDENMQHFLGVGTYCRDATTDTIR